MRRHDEVLPKLCSATLNTSDYGLKKTGKVILNLSKTLFSSFLLVQDLFKLFKVILEMVERAPLNLKLFS